MADTFTPERIAQLRTQIAHMLAQIPYRGGIYALALNTLPAALDEIERLRASIATLEKVIEMTTGPLSLAAMRVRAETAETALSRVTAERDEAVAEMKRLRGSLEYIKAQSVSKAYATSPAMALNVIRANAEAALDNDFQTTVAEARSFLSRMGGRK